MNLSKAFTLVELVVIIGITAVLSAVILFSIVVYIDKARDVNVEGNLAVLLPAGEDFYSNNNSYVGFCNSQILKSAYLQMAKHSSSVSCQDNNQHPGLCCSDLQASWASCTQGFAKPEFAHCVDSRGVKKQICSSSCTNQIDSCPDDDLSSCLP